MTRQFLLFLCCNGFAAGVNFGSRFFFSVFTPYSVAIILAYGCGMVTAFVLSRAFVFDANGSGWKNQAFRFLIVNIAAIFQTLAVSIGCAHFLFPKVDWTWHPEAVAHGIGVAVPAVTSYFGHKYWSFRHA
jgi:putative flippase GtrA